MTVSQLIEELKRLPQDMEVGFQHPSHDYWRTQLVTDVEEIKIMRLGFDGYHDQYSVPKDPDDAEAGIERPKTMVVLR